MKLTAVLSALALSAGVATHAVAADLPTHAPAPAPEPIYAAPIFTWTGFYVGVNVGGIFANHNASLVAASPIPVFVNALFPGTVPASASLDSAGILGGVQAGYNWQMGNIVLGVEADVGVASASKTLNFNSTPFGVAVNAFGKAGVSWLGTARVRLGFTPWDNFLVYATGGAAFGGVENRLGAVASIGGVPIANYAGGGRSTSTGWTVGGGFEYGFNYNWTVKTEYLYYNLGSRTITGVDAGPVFPGEFVSYRVKNDGHIFRVGLNYKFGGHAAPVMARY